MAKKGGAKAKARDGIPRTYRDFEERFPGVSKAFEALGDACHAAGPLTARERRLVKLAVAVGGRLEGAVRAHARRAVREGIERPALDQVAVLAVTTSGLPTGVAALTWIDRALRDA